MNYLYKYPTKLDFSLLQSHNPSGTKIETFKRAKTPKL